jgi:tRNA pseudouridine13 synthase
MQVVASGGVFVVEDPPVEQRRFQAGETVTTGPLFGPKMRQPAGEIAVRESGVLERAGLSPDDFRTFAKLTPGARRAYLVRPADLDIRQEPEGLRIEVALPAGVYATTLLREFQKS